MMDENETTPKKHRRLIIPYVLIILLLICVGAFVIYRLNSKSELQARIDAIREAGYPVTCAELDKWYSIPGNVENAAYTILDAFSYYRQWDKDKSESLPVVGQGELPARTELLDEEVKALITQYVADNNEALKRLHAGAAIKHSRYPVDLSAGFAILLPSLSDIRTAARLLKLEGILHAENSDDELAVRSTISIFGIARSLAKEPVLVSQLTCSSCKFLAATTIEYCLNRIEFNDEQLIRLIDCVRNAELISDMSQAFVGERCGGLDFFMAPEFVKTNIVKGKPSRPILELYKAVGLLDSDTIIYLDIMDEYIKSTQLPMYRRQEAIKAIDARLQSISQAHVLLHLIIPALSRVAILDLRSIAQLRNARVALAIERYRLAAGKLPDALADLVPDYLDSVPEDPFDGDELRYRKLEVGFVVYSIGEDLSDDGGREKPPRKAKESPNWDVTFIVAR